MGHRGAVSTGERHDAGVGSNLLPILATAGAGVVSSLQGRVNGEFTRVTGVALEASAWTFVSGWLVMGVVVLAVPSVRRGVEAVVAGLRSRRLPWYQCIGGFVGAFFVVVQSFSVPLLGVAVFTIAVVAGTTGNALLVDRLGWGVLGRVPVHAGRVAAALLAIVGVAIAMVRPGRGVALALLPVALSMAAGALGAVQSATNARVTAMSRNPMSTTWVNFTVSMSTCLVIVAVAMATGHLRFHAVAEVPWWAWLGGLCGIGYVAVAAWAVGRIGVLVFSLVLLSGQLVSAVALDLLDPAARGGIGPLVLAGIVVTFAAALLGTWFSRRPRRQTR